MSIIFEDVRRPAPDNKPKHKRRKRALKSYDLFGHAGLAKFFDVDDNYDAFKEVAKAIAFGHCKYGAQSTTLTSRNHMKRAVDTWAENNNLNSEQYDRLFLEVKIIFDSEEKNINKDINRRIKHDKVKI